MSNSSEYQLTTVLRDTIVAMMVQSGRDFAKCEQCSAAIPDGKAELHHTKYEGATYYDLEIVCRSCNRIAANVGLA